MIAEPPALISSDDALRRIGHDLTYATLIRWTHNGAVTPTQPAKGSGTHVGWSGRDVMALEAIARVRADLDRLGLPCPWKLVRELWDQLDITGIATLAHGTVIINVRLGLEGA